MVMDPLVLYTLVWIILFGLIDAALWISWAAKKSKLPESAELKRIRHAAWWFTGISTLPPIAFWMYMFTG